MIRKKDLSLLIAQRDKSQEHLLRGTAAAFGMTVNVLVPDAGLIEEIAPLKRTLAPQPVLLADVAALAAQGAPIEDTLAAIRAQLPGIRFVFTLGDRMRISSAQRAWAKALGAEGLFANASLERIKDTVLPIMQAALDADAAEMVAENMAAARVADYLRVLGDSAAGPNELAPYHATINKLEKQGIALQHLVKAVRSSKGFDVADRRYRLKSYPACFIASEAVDVLMKMTNSSRGFAVLLGQLLQQMGLIYHVAADQEFQDEGFFFRSAARTTKLRELSLAHVARAMRASDGVKRKDRSYMGRVYPDCFIGKDAVEWLCTRYSLTRLEAITVGQQLQQLHAFHHVTDEHDFVDVEYFYCFPAGS